MCKFAGCITYFITRHTGKSKLLFTEQLAPRALRFRWLDWLTGVRIGHNGRASFLK